MDGSKVKSDVAISKYGNLWYNEPSIFWRDGDGYAFVKDVSKSRTGMKRHLKIHDLIFIRNWSQGWEQGFSLITGIEQPIMLVRPYYFDYHFSALKSMSALTLNLLLAFRANGGAYSYICVVFGEFPHGLLAGWLLWNLWLDISGAASGWGSYLKAIEWLWHPAPYCLNGTFNPKEGLV